MKYYSYEEFKSDYKELSKKCEEFRPDTIIAVARGGLMLAQYMAYSLDVRDLQSIRAISYDDDHKLESVTLFSNLNLKENSKVLIVDDIVDSGDTLKAILDELTQQHVSVTFRSAAIFYKTTALIQPDFAIKEATEWIEFFWEVD